MKNSFYANEEFFKDKDLTLYTDYLSKIFNRDIASSYCEDLIKNNRPFSFLMCDVDNFKYINDTYGHTVGDQVIIETARILEETLGNIGVVGRFGGDEFIIAIPDFVEYDELWKVCRKASLDFSKAKIKEINNSPISMTIGASRYPFDANNYTDLFNTADKALYRGKQKGRNCFIIYLAEKHANIEISGRSAHTVTMMDLHSKISSMLTLTDNLSTNCYTLNSYLTSHLMLDHVCIQSEDNLYSSSVHQLSNTKEFAPITQSYIDNHTNEFGFAYFNSLESLQEARRTKFYHALEEQSITSSLYMSISAYGKKYGYIRADSTQPNGRIWQEKDMSLFVNYANTLGLILHYTGKSVSEAFK